MDQTNRGTAWMAVAVALLALTGCADKGARVGADGGTVSAADAKVAVDADLHRDAHANADAHVDADVDSDVDTGVDGVGHTDSGFCVPKNMAVVTDIDGTLTTSDAEYMLQIAVSSYDPAMRPDANTLMQKYNTLGYSIFYVTARGKDLKLLDGSSARQATESWLAAHGFPYVSDAVFLSDGYAAFGNAAAAYKTEILQGLRDAGWTLVYAYGNADTDIEAFRNVDIPAPNVFLVGDLAGTMNVSGISNEAAYTQHIAGHMPSVPRSTCDKP